MTKLQVGDKVVSTYAGRYNPWHKGLTGEVIQDRPTYVTVEFENHGGQGHDASMCDGKVGRYHFFKADNASFEDAYCNLKRVEAADNVLTLGDTEEGFTTKHFRAGSQSSRILAHLLKGKSISQGKCNIVYGPWRLSDIILKIRKAGFDVVTTLKKDESGHEYASYTLATKSA